MSVPLQKILEANRTQFHSVVPFDPARHKLVALDLSGNQEITDYMVNDTTAFSQYINSKLEEAGATYGIGGYNEHRSLYSRSRVFDAANDGAEPRRLHLGTDIWGKQYTSVSAPLDGVVHSFGFNEGYGNYGTTIILSHRLNNITFFTLYGHLSRNYIKNMQEGDNIEKGQVFAEFGIPSDNGEWPPHLHIQIIGELDGWSGDYPGVCRFSERDAYLSNCPDPDLVLNLNQYLNR